MSYLCYDSFMTILVTGAAGFIGSHYVLRHIEQYPDDTVIVIDNLNYAADKSLLDPVINRIRFIEGDIADVELLQQVVERYGVEQIVNFAAETHVDRSIQNTLPFLHANIVGVQCLIEILKAQPEILLIHVSTDEVYGDVQDDEPPFNLESPLRPSNPYSATKAAGDLMLLAARRTYDLKIRITRCTNNYGPHQDKSKLIPVIIRNALEGNKIPIYGQGKQKRDWLYVTDHTDAIEIVREKGEDGWVYLIGPDEEKENIQVAKTVLNILGKPHSLIDFVADRPGHDWAYRVDSSLMRSLGWEPRVKFEAGIQKTVDWFVSRRA